MICSLAASDPGQPIPLQNSSPLVAGSHSSWEVVVPAKAMLFGEYGVLSGGPVLVATLADHCFRFRATLTSLADCGIQRTRRDPKFSSSLVVSFVSDLVPDTAEFSSSGEFVGAETVSGPIGFISKCLSVVEADLLSIEKRGLHLHIEVVQGFSPALGLGSSSAMIVGLITIVKRAAMAAGQAVVVHSPLEQAVGCSPLLDEWPLLSAAIKQVQGRGSGYDVAVQWVASREETPLQDQLWRFNPPKASGEMPELIPIEHPEFWLHAGRLLPSGTAAPTGEILEGSQSHGAGARPGGKPSFAQRHAQLAHLAFLRLADPSLWEAARGTHPLADLFDQSLELAQEQGIADHVGQMPNLVLMHGTLAYKTMGAGCGDSLWIVRRCLSPVAVGAQVDGDQSDVGWPEGSFPMGTPSIKASIEF